jgi:hypothetical protein
MKFDAFAEPKRAEDGNLVNDPDYRKARARGFRRYLRRDPYMAGGGKPSMTKGVCRRCGSERYVYRDTFLCREDD